MKDEEFKLRIFDGRDYNIWKKRILLYLKLKKCHEPAIRERLSTDLEAEWNEKTLKAMNYIYYSISNKQVEFISDKETPLDILNKFDEVYLKKSTALQICIRNRLDRMKLKDFKDSSTFFLEFEKIVNELKSAGATVNKREKLDYMLRMLPYSLSYIGDLVDTMKESDRTCEFLKNKIAMWETRSQSEKGKAKSSVFKVEKKNIQCYQCKERGHTKKNCRNS
ncbi:Copia protein [Cyphomyrmex costatus]|uniref:Copia protein n=1 Tax=Cyphomyrmex costatus TaxID=456900 RepID=A0A151I9G0_9HYME|nr:Copia protein [Cyphomyrmex costatus]